MFLLIFSNGLLFDHFPGAGFTADDDGKDVGPWRMAGEIGLQSQGRTFNVEDFLARE